MRGVYIYERETLQTLLFRDFVVPSLISKILLTMLFCLVRFSIRRDFVNLF